MPDLPGRLTAVTVVLADGARRRGTFYGAAVHALECFDSIFGGDMSSRAVFGQKHLTGGLDRRPPVSNLRLEDPQRMVGQSVFFAATRRKLGRAANPGCRCKALFTAPDISNCQVNL